MANIFDLFKKIESERTSPVPITHIVAGLGNTGKEYIGTRHNAGFTVLDAFCEKKGIALKNVKFNSLTAECEIEGKRALLMKPQLYMNRSGECIRDAAAFYKIPPENILVISDDVNLDVGRLRIRRKGSDGGQKGLRDIIYQLSDDGFPRIRVGVGKLPVGSEMVSWVLGKIPQAQQEDFKTAVLNASDAIPLIIGGRTDEAMSKYN